MVTRRRRLGHRRIRAFGSPSGFTVICECGEEFKASGSDDRYQAYSLWELHAYDEEARK